ncbi:hypothetical protein AB0H17_09455 [Streptomyces olivoreticuli]
MTGTTSAGERVERLKALLTGRSSSSRVRAMASGGHGNLLLGVALHGADGVREGRRLTGLEQLLVDALGTIVDEAELKAWGRAYRDTVSTASSGSLIVPELIAERLASLPFDFGDLREALPALSEEVAAAPNVSLLSLEDLAAGSEPEARFVAGMHEHGFAVTGVAPHSEGSQVRHEPWRVRLEMEKFYVERAVGDQGGGRDEIYFTASSSAGGGSGQTFRSEEFGAVKKGQTRTFSTSNKVFLDEQVGPAETAITSIQVWEADQSSSQWYSALQRALNRAVEQIDLALGSPAGIILDPTPLPVTLAYEIAKIFISLMDVLRNNDDLSHSAVFVLTRDDMAVMHARPVVWHFNGDGYHKLTVRYTGERPVYPTGSITFLSRRLTPQADEDWGAPVPVGFKTKTAPRAAVFRDQLYVVFSREDDQRLVWSRYDGTSWTPPSNLHGSVSDMPVALAVHRDLLHCLHTGRDGRIHHDTFDGTQWSAVGTIHDWETARGPALAEHWGSILWSAHTGMDRKLHLSDYRSGAWNRTTKTATGQMGAPVSAPTLASAGNRLWMSATHSNSWQGPSTWWTDNGGTLPTGRWPAEDNTAWHTSKATTLHCDGPNLWVMHTAQENWTYLSRRRLSAVSSGEWMSLDIVEGPTRPTVLDTPALVTYRGRTYAIYHA